jgi:large subunit ribosomal protein L6e
VDVKGLDKKLIEKISDDKYFAREKGEKKKGEDAFFKQGEKPEVILGQLQISEYWRLMCV